MSVPAGAAKPVKKHGLYGYSLGCRCAICKERSSEAGRRYYQDNRAKRNAAQLNRRKKNQQAARAAGGVLVGRNHGLASTYRDGCRCADCQRAERSKPKTDAQLNYLADRIHRAQRDYEGSGDD